MNIIGFSTGALRLTWRAFALVLAVTWGIMRGLARGVRLVRRLAAAPRLLLALTKDKVTCTRCGRVQSLLARWRCPVCKGVETTHAWAACSICGTGVPAGYIACENERCGEAIPNPVLRGVP